MPCGFFLTFILDHAFSLFNPLNCLQILNYSSKVGSVEKKIPDLLECLMQLWICRKPPIGTVHLALYFSSCFHRVSAQSKCTVLRSSHQRIFIPWKYGRTRHFQMCKVWFSVPLHAFFFSFKVCFKMTGICSLLCFGFFLQHYLALNQNSFRIN